MKTALVTGSSSGFGRAVVSLLLKDGWRVFAGLRDVEKSKADFRLEMAVGSGRLYLLSLDVADGKQRKMALASVGDRLDLLINNAGYGLLGPFEETTEEEFRRQLEVNFFGAAFLTRSALPALRASRGRVIVVSSLLGYSGFPLSAGYCASKFALEGLFESLYHELRPHGVQVALVEPGGFRTKMASNAAWGSGSFRDGSAYLRQSKGLTRLREKMLSKPGRPPEAVAAAVLKLANARRMPLRTVVGPDAQFVRVLQKLLPRNAAARLQGAAFDKLFLQEK